MTSFQSFTCIASIVVLAGSVFLEFSVFVERLCQDCAKHESNQCPEVMSQITLYPEFFK